MEYSSRNQITTLYFLEMTPFCIDHRIFFSFFCGNFIFDRLFVPKFNSFKYRIGIIYIEKPKLFQRKRSWANSLICCHVLFVIEYSGFTDLRKVSAGQLVRSRLRRCLAGITRKKCEQYLYLP